MEVINGNDGVLAAEPVEAMGSADIVRVEDRKRPSMMSMGGKATAELRAELHRAELELSNWVAEREQRLGDLQQVGFERAMEARATDFLDIRKAEQETKSRRGHYAAVAKRQKEQLEEERKRLEELKVTEQEELPAKLEVLGAEHARVAKTLEEKRGEMANRRYLKEEELSELGRGVIFYRRLGLEFEGGEVGNDGSMQCLRLVFRQISRTDPDRPYVIAVSIDDEGRYVVPECFPALPEEDFKRMVGDVNYTNNFASFVSRVRRGFVALAEAGL
ncbi:unnamed protein product [Ascophyllum nodosum]